MKIFWFTNTLMPELSLVLGRKPEVIGGWMPSLLDAMRGVEDIEIAVASIDQNTEKLTIYSINGTTYFLLPLKRSKGTFLPPALLSACSEAINTFKPDIIHVHGTENIYGLFTAYNFGACPTVVSIQGLLHVYCRFVRGGLTLRESQDGGKNGFLSWVRFLLQETKWFARGRVEKQIISENRYFIGRSIWDKSHVLSVNPDAEYFYGGELLRTTFFANRWDLNFVRKHTVFCTAAHSPLKGFHWLLYAIILLRQEFPDINVRVAGAPWDKNRGFGYYGRYLKSLVEKYDLSSNITPLPSLTAEDVARELRLAHTFVIPSLIENSPNSLAEAMLIGTPCVAAFVGGIPSMVADGENALCFPASDSEYLAECIRKIFTDDVLAQKLSNSAHLTASVRHNPQKIVTRQLEIYRQVIAQH